MIAVHVAAGLANQMFQYAFSRELKYKGYEVYIDQTNFKPRKEWAFEFVRLQDAFPNIEIKTMPECFFPLVYKTTKKWSLLKKWLDKVFHIRYVEEPRFAYTEGIDRKITWHCNIKGFWQSEKNFKDCFADVRKQFTFLPFDEPKNIACANKMSVENSVAIHLRKGKDYLESELMGKNLCGADYYMKAIEYVRNHVESPVFYIFTDNPQWVKDNLPEFDYTLVDWNEVAGKRNFRDMQLMTCAKHNIIGNSTYSWWGAWINPNPDKIVVAPKKWFNPINDFFATNDVVPDSWIKL